MCTNDGLVAEGVSLFRWVALVRLLGCVFQQNQRIVGQEDLAHLFVLFVINSNWSFIIWLCDHFLDRYFESMLGLHQGTSRLLGGVVTEMHLWHSAAAQGGWRLHQTGFSLLGTPVAEDRLGGYFGGRVEDLRVEGFDLWLKLAALNNG